MIVQKIHFSARWALTVMISACLVVLLGSIQHASALDPIPVPDPDPDSHGIEATKLQDPPKEGATITTPNGGAFSTSPITVNGICPNGLLVEIYNNGVMVGSVMCENGSFSLQVSLFSGTNELSAIVYDNLDQAGPKSNIATVTYDNTEFEAFGELITLTSSYGRRSAAAGTQLSWPLQLSGGTGPYAFSVNWGDGSSADLKSQSLGGVVTIAHTYKKAGIYQASIKATDVNGVSAFLQVVAVASGKVDPATASAAGDDSASGSTSVAKILWVPTVVSLVLLVPAYWLGRRSQLVSLRNKMLKERDSYNKQK